MARMCEPLTPSEMTLGRMATDRQDSAYDIGTVYLNDNQEVVPPKSVEKNLILSEGNTGYVVVCLSRSRHESLGELTFTVRLPEVMPFSTVPDCANQFEQAPSESALELRFKEHASRWRKQTEGMSLMSKAAKHPDYQAIIAMGQDAVPLVLRELRDHGGHWFIALSEMTGEQPIPDEAAGNIKKMREYWLAWGKNLI